VGYGAVWAIPAAVVFLLSAVLWGEWVAKKHKNNSYRWYHHTATMLIDACFGRLFGSIFLEVQPVQHVIRTELEDIMGTPKKLANPDYLAEF